MGRTLARFEHVARNAFLYTTRVSPAHEFEHPFEARNVHPLLPPIIRHLFDDAHYAQATFEAFKFVDREVARLSGDNASGYKLMMAAFSEDTPKLKLTNCVSISERDEQMGFKFLFAGAIAGIRNPRGHEYSITDTMDECLDYLALASTLLRRLEAAGYTLLQNKHLRKRSPVIIPDE